MSDQQHPVKRSTRRVVQAFRQGKARRNSPAIWTDGAVIYSFGIIIAAKRGSKIVVSPAAAAFGRTTRQRIGEVLSLLPKAITATAAL